MNDDDKKILELYLKENKKKKIIITSIVFFIIFICTISMFYLKNKVIIENTSNTIEIPVTNNIPNNNTTLNTNNAPNISQNTSIPQKDNTIVENKQEEKTIVETTQPVPTEKPKDVSTIEKENKKEEKTSKPNNKDFLFTDGYNMENVSQAAQNFLKSSGYSGECVPIKDADGVYLGIRVIFH